MEDAFDFNKAVEDVDLDNLFNDIERKMKPDESEQDNTPEVKSTEEGEEADVEILGDLLGTSESERKPEKESKAETPIVQESPDDFSLKGNPTFYSSIVGALLDDGIFSEIDGAKVDDVKTAEDFSDYIEKQISSRLEEKQKRIDDALSADVPLPVIKQYESTLGELDKITEEQITDEGNDGVELRKTLLYNDFVNRGFSEQRARKEVEKSISSGYDVDDAKEALDSIKKLYKDRYDAVVKEAKENQAKEEAEEKKLAENIKKEILDGSVLGGLDVPKQVRERALAAVLKGTVKDKDGNLYTALQDYERNNRAEFLKNVGILFAMTDGFKNVDKLIGRQVSKEVKKGIRNLENILRTSNTSSGGTLSLMDSGASQNVGSSGKWRLKL